MEPFYVFFSVVLLNVLKQVPIYFSCSWGYYNVVFLWSFRIVLWTMKLHLNFHQHEGEWKMTKFSFLDELLDPLMPSWCTITLYLGKHYFRCRLVKVLNRRNKVPLFVFQGLPGPIGPVGPKGVRVSYLSTFLSTVLLQFDFYLSKLLTLVLWWDHCVCLQTRRSAWYFSDTFHYAVYYRSRL